MNETATFLPGDVVRLTDHPLFPLTTETWVVLRVLADGSLLLRRGDVRRVAQPEEVRR